MPGNIVGAIANEAGLRGSDIGHIEIFDEYSTVDLPTGMPDDIYAILKRAKILNRALSLSLIHQAHQESYETRERPRDYPRAKVGGSGDLPPRRPRPDRPASRKPSKAPRRRG